MTTIHAAPETSPFGVGEAFEVVVPHDVLTHHGNLVVSAGHYMAWQSDFDPDAINLWSHDHYTGNGMWTSLAAWNWHLPGDEPRGIPDHDCADEVRSGVVSGIYCGVCMKVLG